MKRSSDIYWYQLLTHWGRVTHICVGKLTIIGSDKGLSPGRRQAIIWTNAGILLIGPLGTNFSEILIAIQTFSLKKMHLKMLSGKCRPFCLGLNVLKPSYLSARDLSMLWSVLDRWCFGWDWGCSTWVYRLQLQNSGFTKACDSIIGKLYPSTFSHTNIYINIYNKSGKQNSLIILWYYRTFLPCRNTMTQVVYYFYTYQFSNIVFHQL